MLISFSKDMVWIQFIPNILYAEEHTFIPNE